MGFKISQEFPSRFLNGNEVGSTQVPLVIKTIKKEKIFSQKTNKSENTLVVYFEGKDRGVCLGKTRAYDIAKLYGEDTDGWIGKNICLYTEKKDAFGKTLNVIR